MMDLKSTVESVARELILSMKEKKEEEAKANQPKILFVFCDSNAHEPFQDEFIKLNNHNISYDLLFLDGATASWLGLHQIESNGANKVIASDENALAPIELSKKYDAIVIPEIDLDESHRIVNGQKGTIKSEIVFAAFVLNKPVIIGSDTPGIKRADRRCLDTLELPKYFQKKFKNNLLEMTKIGATLVPTQKLLDTVLDKMSQVQGEIQAHKKQQTTSEKATFTGKILSAKWIENNSDKLEQPILLEKKTIISPLAKDMLKESGTIVKYIS